MTLRVATVLSAREWEPAFVAHARQSGSVRLVLRAFRPDDVDAHIEEVDAVVAGGEVSWVTPARVAAWRRSGLVVVGIHPLEDRPAAEVFRTGGADEVLPDTATPEQIVQALHFLSPQVDRRETDSGGEVVAVTGPPGAPGRTEIALALAWRRAMRMSALLIDLDLSAPALAVRLGLDPRPDITDAAHAARTTGTLPQQMIHRTGRLGVLVGSHRPGETRLRESLAEDLVETAVVSTASTILDLGATTGDDRLLKRADHAVVVVEGSPIGLVRGAGLIAEWSGPPPSLILNKVDPSDASQVVAAARRWTGLEPRIVIPYDSRIRRAGRSARAPDRRLLRRLQPLGNTA